MENQAKGGRRNRTDRRSEEETLLTQQDPGNAMPRTPDLAPSLARTLDAGLP